MRSIFREKSMEFFDILKVDREDWHCFWERFCRINKDYMKEYLVENKITEEKALKILDSLSRPFLDSLRQENEQIREIKRNTVSGISKMGNELKLSDSDFTLYLISALGVNDTTIVKNTKDGGYLVLIDIVSLKKNDNINRLPEIAIDSAKTVRNILDRESKEEN